jgi:hypothetical protein
LILFANRLILFSRPVDPLLSAVLTCDIDPTSLRDVQRWLGFIVVALPILTNQVGKAVTFLLQKCIVGLS